ncbi:hypothetical protein BT69DRAFT_1330254 [Atractiella rhizophila]|nr:hypothetical protein BT69DRAFT_1330254 [Atractiella rhizophila]
MNSLQAIYEKETSKLTQLLTELGKLGIKDEKIPLPGIIVVGNQSAGKSSLVEAISKISLPRDVNTCTRCPITISMSNCPSMDTVEYKFSIQIRYDRSTGDALTAAESQTDSSRANVPAAFGSFHRLLPRDTTGYPDEQVQRLSGKKQFSKNIIHVEEMGPYLPNLVFTDLPGIISNTGSNSSENTIELVQSLVAEQMSVESNIILVAMPMTDDMNNQAAFRLAAAADPGAREQLWLPVFNNGNKDFSLKHGYFITMQPGYNQERTPGWNQKEKLYFQNEEPWSNHDEVDRMGIGSLVTYLVKLLSERFCKSLPTIRQMIVDRLKSIDLETRVLPVEPSGNPIYELHMVCQDLARQFRSYTHCLPGDEGLIQSIDVFYKQFERQISGHKPYFSLGTESGGSTPSSEVTNVDLLVGIGETNHDAFPHSENGYWEIMNLPEVREHIRLHKGLELPFSTPYSAKSSLIRKSTECWEDFALECLDRVRESVEGTFTVLCEKNTGKFYQDRLFLRCSEIFSKASDGLFLSTRKTLLDQVSMDFIPFTQNFDYFVQTRTELYRTMQGIRAPVRNIPQFCDKDPQIRAALSALALIGCHGISVDKLPALFGPDDYDEELVVMADVLSYFKVSYKVSHT